MSFALTTLQFINGTKDVTRRKGWTFLKPGDRFMAVLKSQGLKPGEKLMRLGECEVVSVRREPLHEITFYDYDSDVRREGFPRMTPIDFVEMFCKHMGGDDRQIVTRIEFRRISVIPAPAERV